MITFDEILNLEYYKKTSYTGWTGGMRFLIKREVPEEGEPLFHAWIWPGPYIFDLVPPEKKFDATYPFTDEGKQQLVDWLNLQYDEHTDIWPKKKTQGA